MGIVKNRCDQSGYGTLKLAVCSILVLAYWYKFRKAKSWYNDFWVGLLKDGSGLVVHSAASRCILVPFERYGRPKKCAQIISCDIFPYIFHVKTKLNIVYEYLKTKIFSRDTYPSPNSLNIKYFWTLSYNHWRFFSITKLSSP